MFWWVTVLLDRVEPVVSDPVDESALGDVLSSHDGEDFGAFAVSRWPGLLRQISRRGKSVRRWRVGAAVGGLGLAGIAAAIIATMAPTPRNAPEQAFPVTAQTTSPAQSGGVFASGTSGGHAWRLAVQDIADPGYRCLPAITLNGTDADPVSPDPGNGADITLGPAAPGIGFAFIQLPADIRRLAVDSREVLPAVTVTACGERYRLVGFAFPLTREVGITVADARPSWPKLRIERSRRAARLAGQLSAAAGRHLATRDGDDPADRRAMEHRQLHPQRGGVGHHRHGPGPRPGLVHPADVRDGG